MRWHPLALLTVAVLLPLAAPARAADGDDPRADEQTLRAAGLPTDDAALLAFLRRRAQPETAPGRLPALVRDLGDPSAERRERAAAELVAFGPVSLPLLRAAARDADDAPRAGRARLCLQQLEGEQAGSLPAAVARLLGHRRPAGAAEVLLAYLPFADDDAVLDDVRASLAALAVRDGKPEPALLAALTDPLALRRATAAEVLGEAGGPEARPHLRRLIADPLPAVRLRVALTLARDGHDPEAVSTLIALLTEAPVGEARRAEDYLQSLAAEQAPRAPKREDAASRQKYRDSWAQWWGGKDGPALLEEVKRRTVTDEARARALRLIQQLNNESFAAREKATRDLQALGSGVAPFLRQFVNDPDPEVSSRVAKVLKAARGAPGPLSPVVVRLLALRKPDGAAEALLAFLVNTDDEDLIAEVQGALAALAVRDGKVEPALVRALGDPLPLRRGVAAAALWESGEAAQRSAVRPLLADPDPAVRRRVALAVAASRDRAAVPVLIDLLADLAPGPATEVEEFLQRVAGDRAPDARPGAGAASRQKCRDAWAAWWQANGARADLPTAASRGLLGYTLVLFQDRGSLAEIGPDRKQRWEITGLGNGYDVQPVRGNRVLIAEYGSGRVTERTARGDVVWEKRIGLPINCQRLPNGHTVIGTHSGVVEVDRAGNEVFSLQRPQGDLAAARRARDGSVFWVNYQGECQHLDARGRVLKSFSVGPNGGWAGLEVLSGGHVLVALYNEYRVAEYDADGKVVWSASVPGPTSAVRLPNGHTLVSSMVNQKVLELDRAGKTVWEFGSGKAPWRAVRR
jgi:HEAT repeat protein